MTTLFAKIIRGEIPSDTVYQDELVTAFRDINPQAPTHILVIPRKEIRSMAEVTAADKEVLGHMLCKVSEIAKAEGLAEDGYRTVINTNDHGGQTVFHLHMHILGGRQLQWPPG